MVVAAQVLVRSVLSKTSCLSFLAMKQLVFKHVVVLVLFQVPLWEMLESYQLVGCTVG
jgi:hypothetical protein